VCNTIQWPKEKAMHNVVYNCMFYKIVDIEPVEESFQICSQKDDNILESLLRGIRNTVSALGSALWESLMCHISDYMSTLY
jgi:hypothetical protein